MQFLLNPGIIIYAIGIGKAIEEELLEIASEPSYKHLFYAEDFTALEDISEELRAQICEGKKIPFSLQKQIVSGVLLFGFFCPLIHEEYILLIHPQVNYLPFIFMKVQLYA